MVNQYLSRIAQGWGSMGEWIPRVLRPGLTEELCTPKRFDVFRIEETSEEASELDACQTLTTIAPASRPPFQQWAKEMGLGKPVLYYNHPDGKQRADALMEKVGLKDPEPWIDRVLGLDK